MGSICGMTYLEPDKEQPWMLMKPNQWWRLIISIFYHHGMLQLGPINYADTLYLSIKYSSTKKILDCCSEHAVTVIPT